MYYIALLLFIYHQNGRKLRKISDYILIFTDLHFLHVAKSVNEFYISADVFYHLQLWAMS